ncbi:Asparagine synthetase domain-containing protein [Neolecta irregularis DAH-3]|uniref:Asparagine synthetase domain-containing protein n=1 Tax=Neolecta irregularis (strain DAH-3) TaxID=1198029 RepID=A0A1U7LPW1_NEOID|nr:Asparagine synthetase domain-containing protein [Neolecta irregularis DAH-3]|eukprot:OLL24669.1 Asparagine synthetase domain-containing protein [Neolecta irregularis DAH-3]
MCGIFFSIRRSTDIFDASIGTLEPYIKARGPDSYSTCIQAIHLDALTTFELTCSSSVLHLRGNDITTQPLVSQEGNILCWNGEVWCSIAEWMPYYGNDGSRLLDQLSGNHNVSAVMEDLQGPYAFVYFQKDKGKVWFGRDRLGRRSLLRKTYDIFILSSVGESSDEWDDVLANGIYCLDLSSSTETYDPYLVGNYIYILLQQKKSRTAFRPYFSLNTSIPSESGSWDPLTNFHYILLEAIRIRAVTIPNSHMHKPRVAVLYSGGLDCGVIARLLHDVLPVDEPIDLLNVAFENPRRLSVMPGSYDGPPRIDVPFAEAMQSKKEIFQLAHPNDSVMDLDISMAFYFSARARGIMRSQDGNKLEYSSTAKVLFSGMGADEQLGGYSRHLKTFKAGGWEKLIQELQVDIDRLPTRNLGRDDRIISHHGREVRYPFLDENVVLYLCSLQIDQKVDFSHVGGDKLLLRRLAARLGIVKTAREKKRAVQFGSKAAKMEVGQGKVKGQQKIHASALVASVKYYHITVWDRRRWIYNVICWDAPRRQGTSFESLFVGQQYGLISEIIMNDFDFDLDQEALAQLEQAVSSVQKSFASPANPDSGFQQPTPRRLNNPGGSNNILVNPRQVRKGNRILDHIRNVPWEYDSELQSDFVVGTTTCALFLSLKYHRLHPEYVYNRIQALGKLYNLRILLVRVDIDNHTDSIRDLTKTSIINNLTIILAWTDAEAGRYLETFKSYEMAQPTLIMEKQAPDYASRIIDTLTSVRSVNKADALSLISNFGSLRNAMNAIPEEILMIGGWGQQKVDRFTQTIEAPFVIRNARKQTAAIQSYNQHQSAPSCSMNEYETMSSALLPKDTGQPSPLEQKLPNAPVDNPDGSSASVIAYLATMRDQDT